MTSRPAKDKSVQIAQNEVIWQKYVSHMQETGNQQDNEEENSFAAEDLNDPVAYAEFKSTNIWEEILRENFTV